MTYTYRLIFYILIVDAALRQSVANFFIPLISHWVDFHRAVCHVRYALQLNVLALPMLVRVLLLSLLFLTLVEIVNIGNSFSWFAPVLILDTILFIFFLYFFFFGPLSLSRATVFFFTLHVFCNTSAWMVDAVSSSFMHYYCCAVYVLEQESNKHQRRIGGMCMCNVQCTSTCIAALKLLEVNCLAFIRVYAYMGKYVWSLKRLSNHIIHSRTYVRMNSRRP